MIRRAMQYDAETLAQLAVKMWAEHTVEELSVEFEMLIADENASVFLCYEKDMAIGFAQCQLRYDYVEGTRNCPVGYLEGVFVEEKYRKRGYGKMLLSVCEQWAKEKGCAEFASDCELDNTQSYAFHSHSGFAEVNRIVCFVKKI